MSAKGQKGESLLAKILGKGWKKHLRIAALIALTLWVVLELAGWLSDRMAYALLMLCFIVLLALSIHGIIADFPFRRDDE